MVGNRFVIRGHHPVRNTLAVLAGALLALAAVAVAHWQGDRASAGELRGLKSRVDRQVQRIDALELANRDLRTHLAMAQRGAQIDAQAASAARSSLARTADKVRELKRTVGFYRSVLASDNKRNRLDIHSVRIAALTRGTYEFEVVLTRFLNAEEVIEGTLGLVVSRSRDADVNPRVLTELPFTLKHFKRIKGELHLPDNFLPTEILVQAAAKDRQRVVRVKRSFPWEKITSG